jgi:hypothetical protein
MIPDLTPDIRLVLSSEYVNLAQTFQHYGKISIVAINPDGKGRNIKIWYNGERLYFKLLHS